MLNDSALFSAVEMQSLHVTKPVCTPAKVWLLHTAKFLVP